MALTQLFGFHAFLAELLGHALQSLWMPSEERSGPLATVPDRYLGQFRHALALAPSFGSE